MDEPLETVVGGRPDDQRTVRESQPTTAEPGVRARWLQSSARRSPERARPVGGGGLDDPVRLEHRSRHDLAGRKSAREQPTRHRRSRPPSVPQCLRRATFGAASRTATASRPIARRARGEPVDDESDSRSTGSHAPGSVANHSVSSATPYQPSIASKSRSNRGASPRQTSGSTAGSTSGGSGVSARSSSGVEVAAPDHR